MTAAVRMHDDFLDSLLTDCEPTIDSDLGLGFSPFEFPISKSSSAYTSPSITPSIVAPSISPSQTKTICGVVPEMKLERAASPRSSAEHPGSPTSSCPTKRAFDDIVENSVMSATVLKVSISDVDEGDEAAPTGNPPTKKRKQEDRRERKNSREKQRRTELNALFDNMVDLLGLPKETKADKVTVLASAINTIRQLRSTISPELLQQLVQQPVAEKEEQAAPAPPAPAPPAPAPVVEYEAPEEPQAAQPLYMPSVMLRQPAAPFLEAPIPSIEELTYFDPGSVFSDM